MKCQNCGLENPETAQRCDCGFDFLSKKLESSYLKAGAKTASTKNPWPYITAGVVGMIFSGVALPSGLERAIGWLLSDVVLCLGSVYLLERKGYSGWWAVIVFVIPFVLLLYIVVPPVEKRVNRT